jgi:hypothetical protein
LWDYVYLGVEIRVVNRDGLDIGAEERALLLLSGIKSLPGAEEALQQVSSFDRFAWLANEHGVTALVRKNLSESRLSDLLPETTLQSLRNQAFKSIARNSFIMTALEAATILLNREGIVPVLLKGTALELSVYDGSGLRPMSDADILLPAGECMRAWRVLQAAGYRAMPFKSPLFRLIPMYVGKHLPSLIKGGFSLEIHHSLWRGRGEELTRRMMGEAEDGGRHPADGEDRTMAGGRKSADGADGAAAGKRHPASDSVIKVKIPPPGLHFLYLVSHLATHEMECSSQLRMYNDLVAMIDFYSAREVIGIAMEHAEEAGLEKELRNKLGIIWKYMGAAIPEEYRVEPDRDAEKLFAGFLRSPKNNAPVNRKASYRVMVKSVPGLHRKLIFLLGDIFPGLPFMKKRYGKQSAWQVLPYYFVRPAKLLWLFS